MQVELLSTQAELDRLAPEWNQLAEGRPLLSFNWLGVWNRHYQGKSSSPWVVTVRDPGGTLVGLAPWRMQRSLGMGRSIRWLGDGEVCTDHTTVLATPPFESPVVESLTAFLLRETEIWDVACLTNVDCDDRLTRRLIEGLAEGGCARSESRTDNCWAIDLPPSWDDFLVLHSANNRRHIRLTERRILSSDRCCVHRVETEADLARAWPILIDLHQKRFQSQGFEGCFKSAKFTAFHREATQRLLEAGQLELVVLTLDGRPGAVEYSIRGKGVIHVYQGGIEPELMADEPGRALKTASIRRAIERGDKSFDFMRGDEPYKHHWRATARPTSTHQVGSPRTLPRIRVAAADAYSNARRVVRSARSAWRDAITRVRK